MVLNFSYFPLVKISFYGWGNPEIPETVDDVKDYLGTVDTDIPVPKWIYELVDQLLDLKDSMGTYGGTKLRESVCSKSYIGHVFSSFFL